MSAFLSPARNAATSERTASSGDVKRLACTDEACDAGVCAGASAFGGAGAWAATRGTIPRLSVTTAIRIVESIRALIAAPLIVRRRRFDHRRHHRARRRRRQHSSG